MLRTREAKVRLSETRKGLLGRRVRRSWLAEVELEEMEEEEFRGREFSERRRFWGWVMEMLRSKVRIRVSKFESK